MAEKFHTGDAVLAEDGTHKGSFGIVMDTHKKQVLVDFTCTQDRTKAEAVPAFCPLFIRKRGGLPTLDAEKDVQKATEKRAAGDTQPATKAAAGEVDLTQHAKRFLRYGLLGLIATLVKIGEWKARNEVQLDNLEKRIDNSDGKMEAIAVLQSQQNLVLTEIKTRLEFLIEGKVKRKKADG